MNPPMRSGPVRPRPDPRLGTGHKPVGSLVAATWLCLVPPVVGALIGACIMVYVFGVAEQRCFHSSGFTLVPNPPTPAKIEQWAREEREQSIKSAMELPQDKLWRAWAGLLSNLDRVSFEGQMVLAFLGALGGFILGGVLTLLEVRVRELVRVASPWLSALVIGFLGAIFFNWLFHLGGDVRGWGRPPSPLSFQDRLTGRTWFDCSCNEPRVVGFWFRVGTLALGASPGVLMFFALRKRIARIPREQKRGAFLADLPAESLPRLSAYSPGGQAR